MFLARISLGGRAVLTYRTSPGTLVRLDTLFDGCDDAVALLDRFGEAGLRERVESFLADSPADGAVLQESQVSFLPPVATCSKLVCVALNYLAHAEEGDFEPPAEPVIFFKPPSTLLGHGQVVRCPARSSRLDYEVELAVVIGKRARDVPADQWEEVVAGYTILNDVTARDLQLDAIDANIPWDRSKGFDGFAPLGPYLVTKDDVPAPQELDLGIRIGGRLLQSSNTRLMIFGIGELIADITAGMTLEPGDVIGTGTPDGIGPAAHGDVMEATIAGLGTLRTPVQYVAMETAALVH